MCIYKLWEKTEILVLSKVAVYYNIIKLYIFKAISNIQNVVSLTYLNMTNGLARESSHNLKHARSELTYQTIKIQKTEKLKILWWLYL